MSALLPGSADAERFWRNIVNGIDLFSEVPPSHWRIDDYYDPDPDMPDKVYVRRGGFLPDVDFSPMDFGIPPNVLPATDTAQLLALMVAQQVLQDAAGGELSQIDRERVSVILGAAGATELLGSMSGRLQRPVWERTLRAGGLSERQIAEFSERAMSNYAPWQENTFPGLLGNVVAGRIANRFDLGGTNCVIDAACASSLAALEVGLHELYLGESDMVITGGVDACNDISMFMCFSTVTAMSPTGDCRPFSDQSDGTMLGEGLAMFALKRLDDAERDGDQIYAVIKGIGTSSDGRAKSIYAPSPAGQAKALRRAYAAAGYGPETVGLVEAHGTGTKAGDIAEFSALREVFATSGRADQQWCALGSVKSQVGHTKGAAGAVGLFKAVMAVHHQTLPPTIKVDQPNPHLEIEKSPFYLSTQTKPWLADEGVPRRASVSSFGFGGTNFHIAVEEYTGVGKRAPRYRSCDSELIVLGAPSVAVLADDSARLSASLVDSTDMLSYIARSAQSAYDATQPHRLAVVADSVSDLRAKLSELAGRLQEPCVPTLLSSPKGYYYSAQHPGPVALLFPGQGSQYVGMGADIPQLYAPALVPWERARADHLNADRDLHQIVWPKTAFTTDHRALQAAELTKTEWAQPAIGAHSLSLLSIVRALGIAPVAVGGHSFGEVIALHAAGVFSEDVALQIARQRGALMAEAAASSNGAMCAVTAPAQSVRELIEEWGLSVAIANHNAPDQVVISGDAAAIHDAAQRFKAAGVNARRLDVATAFHSEIVSSATGPFNSLLAAIPFGTPKIPVYANATGQPYGDDAQTIRATLAGQIAQPVRFAEQTQAMWQAGARTFIEVGPGNVLTNLVSKCLADKEHSAISLDAKGRNGIRSLWIGLAQLAAAGVPMRFEALWADYRLGEDPRTRQQQKLTLKINGSNYGKPPTSDEPMQRPTAIATSTDRSHHNGHRIESEPTLAPKESVTFGVHASTTTSVELSAPARVVPSVLNGNGHGAAASVAVAPPSSPAVATAASPSPTAPSSGVPDVGADVVAEMFAALGTLQDTVDQMRGLLERLASRTAVTSAPAAAPLIPNGKPPVPEPRPAPPPPNGTPPPAAPTATPATDTNLINQMLEVVADKTGYPVEILDLSMALETDLGVDSIKRVEILSAVQERLPTLPNIDTATMATLTTLQEIVDHLHHHTTHTGAPPTPPLPNGTPPPAAPTATPATDTNLINQMLEVVADKTGYPVEILDLSMALETDLGIDSIKRVEILSAVQERLPTLPNIDTATMATLTTLQEIVDHLHPTPAATDTGSPAGDRLPFEVAGAAIARYSVRAIAAPASGMGMPGLYSAAKVEIVATQDDNVANALAAILRTHGIGATIVGEPSSEAEAVVHLGGLRRIASREAALATNRTLFADAQRIAARFQERGGVFVTVQDTGGTFGLLDEPGSGVWTAGIAALTKTVAQEWPTAQVKAIDIAVGHQSAISVAEHLAQEILAGGPELEVGVDSSHGRVTIVADARSVAAHTPRIDCRDVIVVSGGGRGVTAASVIALAERTQASFVLIGRTELGDEPAATRGLTTDAELKRALLTSAAAQGLKPTPRQLEQQVQRIAADRDVRATLAALNDAGSRVRYAAVDVRDSSQLATLLASVRAEFGAITGLIHGAGVLADAPLHKKTLDGFDRVFDTKVGGLCALLDATAVDELKLVCLFSSVAARSGNVGQSDYAMANEILNKVAAAEQARRGQACLVRALGWGPWDSGMVTPGLKAMFESRGISLIPLADGAQAFVSEVLDADIGSPEVIVGGNVLAGLPTHPIPMEGRVARVTAHVKSQPYLIDHRIQDNVVLPLTQAVEWFVRMTEACRPGQRVNRLIDLKVLRGVTLHEFEQHGDPLLVRCAPVQDQPHRLTCTLTDSSESAAYYSATIEMGSGSTVIPSLSTISRGSRRGRDTCYNHGALFHGPAFQVIDSVDCWETSATASLHGVTAAGWPGEGWATDPAALDGCLQLALIWSFERLGRTVLPLRLGEVVRYQAGPLGQGLRCVLSNGDATNNRVVCDLDLVDAGDLLVASLKRLELYPYGH
ncbi:SDR family oxidoreductase [Mycobacterium vicinigordonae]|uniref:SDR family oxidoreductase n=1 Tax=Mycobacterium vicinigordonae TaxID=1719132 RepID=A0A7D6DYD4_9MYCO|nr:SDR family oxidoreductase [Mycobacterium vicinigordonae]